MNKIPSSLFAAVLVFSSFHSYLKQGLRCLRRNASNTLRECVALLLIYTMAFTGWPAMAVNVSSTPGSSAARVRLHDEIELQSAPHIKHSDFARAGLQDSHEAKSAPQLSVPMSAGKVRQSASPLTVAAVQPNGLSGSNVALPRLAMPAPAMMMTPLVYGPRTFTRAQGSPVTESETFTLPTGAQPPFSMCVANGAADGTHRVSSAWIKLNGDDVFRPRDFNQQVSDLSRPVTLLPANTIEVRLMSAPASHLTITIGAVCNAPANQRPVANAGPDQSVVVGTTAQLSGTLSVDPDGDQLTYSWTLLSVPAGSLAVLDFPTSSTPSFLVDTPGSYTAQLVVSDGVLQSPPDEIVISTVNSPPVAQAGADQSVTLGTVVQLNGSESSDVDGNALTYQWQFLGIPPDSNAFLSDPTSIFPTFTADKRGDYVIELTVNDGTVSSSDQVVITTLNSAPEANAGPDQTVIAGHVVQLNGSASTDVDGDALTYRWAVVSRPTGSTAQLSDSTIVNPTFLADRVGTYAVQLTVNDGIDDGIADTVTITTRNTAPVADAGPDQLLTLGTAVTLDGSGSSDVDGQPLTYQWSLLSAPPESTATLLNANAATASFTTDRAGTYVAQLIVSDGFVDSEPDTVVIAANTPPVANAGPDQQRGPGAVQLNGSGSSDAEGDPLTYTWSLLSQPSTSSTPTLSDPAIANPTFVAATEGVYVAQLIVSDGTFTSDPDTVTITIVVPNQAPVVNAGPDQSIMLPTSTAVLNGTVSDDDKPVGAALTVSWSQVSGPATVSFSPPNAANTQALFSVAGTYVLRLTASDTEFTASDDATVAVSPPTNHAPVVSAGANQTITLPTNTVTLNGSATDDGQPNGTLSISWTKVSGTAAVTFGNASVAITQASFAGPGTYVLRITASDSELSSSADVTILVNPEPTNHAPVLSAGPNRAITLPTDTLTLNGTVTDDGLPSGTLTIAWSQVSGPTTALFSNPSQAVTDVTFTAIGTYVLRLTATDSLLSASSTVSVTVFPSAGGLNQAPFVNAGPDQNIVLPDVASLNGVVVDDGLPNNTLTISWSKVSGEGEVTFGDATAPVTTASFSNAGRYVLRLTASDSQLASSSDINVLVGKLDGHRSNKGTDFWLIFPANAPDQGTAKPQLFITGDINTSGTVALPGLGVSIPFAVNAGQITKVELPTTAHVVNFDTVEHKGVHVTADAEITIYGLSYLQFATDGFLALPTPVLGTDYIAIGYKKLFSGSEFGIVASQDATTVTITPPINVMGRVAGQPYSVVLNQGRTYQITANTQGTVEDLTGTIITADKPIGVFSGHVCANIPVVFGAPVVRACNHLLEQLPPTDIWGQQFVTMPIATRSKGDLFRVLAAQNGTTVVVNGTTVGTLNRGEFYETILDKPSEFSADKPVLLAQYEMSFEWDHRITDPGGGDPSFILIPPYDQFGGNYTLAAPSTGFDTHFVNLVTPTTAVGNIMLDGTPIPAASFTPIGSSSFSGAQVQISTGTHHFNAPEPFGTMMYGFFSFDTYGYQAGIALNSAKPGTLLSLTPATRTQLTGTQLCATASIADPAGAPLGGIGVAFAVTGPNPTSKFIDTNSNGQAALCYTGGNAGLDSIVASIGSSSAIAKITWDNNATNQAPVVNAGRPQQIRLPQGARLTASATDDGLPGALAVSWSVVDGAGTVSFSSANQAVTNATFSTEGAYTLRLTANDSQLSTTSDVVITVLAAEQNQAPNVNAGAAQTITLPTNSVTLNATATDDGLPSAAKPALQWTEVSRPLGANPVVFSNSTGLNTTATFNLKGTYVLRFTADDSKLSASSDVTITVIGLNQPPSISAGAAQTITLPTTSITTNPFVSDDGLPVGGTLNILWTQTAGPAPVTFSAPTQKITQVSFPVAGSYSLQLAVSDSEKTSTAILPVTVNPANAAPTASIAPSFQIITLPVNTATLTGTITDDGRPSGTVSASWTLTSGPAAVVFSAPNQATTQVTFTEPGNYNFQLIADDSQLTASATATVQVRPANKAPVVSAGPNKTLALPTTTVSLTGTVSDDGLPSGAQVTSTWSQVSGPATVSFNPVNQLSTQATFTVDGTYVLRLTASDTQLSASSDVTVTVFPAPQNLPPVVSAGLNQTVAFGTLAVLSGSITDDGLPAGATVSRQWTQVSGPATATIFNPSALTTSTSYTVAGTYVFRLTASDTQLTSSADVTITVLLPPNTAPSVATGAFLTFSLPTTTATLNGSVQDDGRPNGTLTAQWSQSSGPAVVSFANPAQASTQATFPVAGTYQLRLTGSDSQLSASAGLTVFVNPANKAPVISVTPTVGNLTLPNNTISFTGQVTDDGLPAGGALTVTWSQVSGPGQVIFSSPNQVATSASFPATGVYQVRISAHDSELTSSATISVTVLAAAPPLPRVSIESPAADSEITKPMDIIASVSSGIYKVEYSLNNDDGSPNQNWVTLTLPSAFTPIVSEVLGKLDPSVLLNGTYTLRVTTTDSYGQVGSDTTTFTVGKSLKVGNFSISFTDLSVPVAGLPIQIVRTYDSRNKQMGDFGVGWTLSIANVRLEKNRPLGPNWIEEVQTSGFVTTSCLQAINDRIVTVTFPGDVQYKFKAVSGPQCQAFGPITAPTLKFVQLPGSPGTAGATLAPLDGGSVLVDGPVPGVVNLTGFDGNIYNPKVFRLTTTDGLVYVIDQKLGVTSMSDPSGNTLTIGENGITHSSGKSVTFIRDAQRRITQITDPNNNVLKYDYFGQPVLLQFTDAANNRSFFNYGTGFLSTFLGNIQLPNNVTPIRNEYNNSGQLIKTTDAFNKTIIYDHNLTARRETITDRNGNATIFEYDDDGNVTRVTDPNGKVTSATYDQFGNKLSETNQLNKTTTYTYDGLGNRTSETDPLGNKTTYTYNARRQVLTITDALGRKTTNVYDTKGNLLSTKDPLGNETKTTYFPSGLPSSVEDAAHNITLFEYDTAGNLTKQTDALNNITTFTYDSNGNRKTQSVTRTKADASTETLTTSYDYDKLNRLTKTTFPDGTFTQIRYNNIGKQEATIDALLKETTYTYDNMGRLTKTTYPDSTFENFTYDNEDRRLTSSQRGDPAAITTYVYDKLGRLEKTIAPGGATSITRYDDAGQVKETEDALLHITKYTYDDAGRRKTVTDALNHVTTFDYDKNGNQTLVTDARNKTTQFVYDEAGRRTKVIYHDQSFEQTDYDELGRVKSKRDQAGKITQYTYDKLGRLKTVKDALNQVTSYAYDEVGNRVSQTDANTPARTTTYEYDKMGRRSKRILPLEQFESYTYDNAGKLKTKIDFNGKTTTYNYDDSTGRLLSKTPDPSFGAAAVTFTYFTTGMRQSMTDPSGTTNYTYDNRNRLKTKATPFGTLTYNYDAINLLSIVSSNANGASMTYTYDELNRLKTVANPGSGTTTYSYDEVGNLAGYVYPNGVSTSYTYNDLNRLTQMGSTKAGNPLSSYTYTLGPAGNRTTVAELTGRSVTYGYDDLYRLTSETIASDPAGQNGAIGYTYDAVGNRLSMTSTVPAIPAGLFNYDANDRLTTDAYDNNGNTTVNASIANSYDFENHLVQRGAITVVYDGDGNRVSKTAGGLTTKYLVDTNNLTGYGQVLDELVSGSVVRSYVYGLHLISKRETGNLQLSFYGYDGHRSVRQLTDSTGAVTDTYDYDSFGNLVNRIGTTLNTYLYAGEQFDPDLSLYYNRARYLNTNTGRFWTMDQEGFEVEEEPMTLHKYLYASSNPVNMTDPSGYFAAEISGAISISNTLDSLPQLNPKLSIQIGSRAAFTLSERGLKFIGLQEGLRTRLYNDSAGHCTIGYGHLVHLGRCNGTEPAEFQQGITKQRALDILQEDVGDTIRALRRNTTVSLAQKEFDALTSFVFNIGETNYRISDLRKTLNQGLYFLVPPLFFRFTRAGDDPNRLRSRRQDEAYLFQFGLYRVRGQIVF